MLHAWRLALVHASKPVICGNRTIDLVVFVNVAAMRGPIIFKKLIQVIRYIFTRSCSVLTGDEDCRTEHT